MQILPYWCISLLFGCISFPLKVCCILHEVRCWKSRVMLTHLDAAKMAIYNYKFACMLHSWTFMFTPGRCSKMEYLDSLYCNKFGHFSSLSTRTYQWILVLVIVLVRELRIVINAWEFVCVNSGIFNSFIVLEHAWVIDLCWLVSLLTCTLSTWECWSFAHAWVSDCVVDWLLHVCYIDLEELILSPKVKGDLKNCFIRMWNSCCKSSSCCTCFCLTWKSVVWRSMLCWLVFSRWFIHQDVRVHGNVHMMWHFFLWRSKRKRSSSYILAWVFFKVNGVSYDKMSRDSGRSMLEKEAHD